ncbi:MAG: NADH-dependent dehydrogenase [Pirellulaceae bacterium]|nr:MAG: NADH-dependent dehydrogenase [Pirellulaceae bacterium]
MASNLETLASIDYRPPVPRTFRPGIGLIGCGGIAVEHLTAYRHAGWEVRALCDVRRKAAEQRAQQFYPAAKVYTDFRDLLRQPDIEVVDVATHPMERPPIVEAALRAGKHVLSQKPFVLDLDVGERLADLADARGLYLAVNQNGRWAPHFSFARQAVARGVLGKVFAAHLSCHWDHTWVEGTPFERIRHLILYDYGIHWFDIVRCFIADEPVEVFARTAPAHGQRLKPHLLAATLIHFPTSHATLAFDAALQAGPHDRTFLSATHGSLLSHGEDYHHQRLEVRLAAGTWSPRLEGRWFPDGFQGAMGELLCAIEEGRPTSINARDNLQSLALCFAAVHSADTGQPVKPGAIRSIDT